MLDSDVLRHSNVAPVRNLDLTDQAQSGEEVGLGLEVHAELLESASGDVLVWAVVDVLVTSLEWLDLQYGAIGDEGIQGVDRD